MIFLVLKEIKCMFLELHLQAKTEPLTVILHKPFDFSIGQFQYLPCRVEYGH